MFDAKPSEPDVAIDLIIWLNLRIRMTAMPKTFKIGESGGIKGFNGCRFPAILIS